MTATSNMPVPKDLILEHKAFIDAIKEVENSVKAGFSSKHQKWFPHKSAEGGTDTLAYGHKLTREEDKTGLVTIGGVPVNVKKDGITNEQANTLLTQDLKTALIRARSEWNGQFKDKKAFDDLKLKYQGVLVDLVFNVGTMMNKVNPKRFGWPILGSYIVDDNEPKVRSGMVRSYTDTKGVRHKLTRRRDVVADALGLAKA